MPDRITSAGDDCRRNRHSIPMITRHPPTSPRGSDIPRLANASLQTSRCSSGSS
jgi:hypothetical protein